MLLKPVGDEVSRKVDRMGAVISGRRIPAAQHLVLETIRLPSGLVEAVVEVVRDVGARLGPRLLAQTVHVELVHGHAPDVPLSIHVHAFTVRVVVVVALDSFCDCFNRLFLLWLNSHYG